MSIESRLNGYFVRKLNQYTIDNDDLEDVRMKLDKTHNGLEEVKSRIIEYLAVKQMTNNLRGPIICLVGPPGVGKTSLANKPVSVGDKNYTAYNIQPYLSDCGEYEISTSLNRNNKTHLLIVNTGTFEFDKNTKIVSVKNADVTPLWCYVRQMTIFSY